MFKRCIMKLVIVIVVFLSGTYTGWFVTSSAYIKKELRATTNILHVKEKQDAIENTPTDVSDVIKRLRNGTF